MRILGWLCVPLALVGGCLVQNPQQAQQEHVQRLCNDQQYAYEVGHNQAIQREPMNSQWADQYCSPETRDWARKAYLDGYDAGAARAPAYVPAPAPAQVPSQPQGLAPTQQPTCTFSSDCAEEQSCRDRGDGVDVCMGFGESGDYCWFSSDCYSGSCSNKRCR